MKKVFILFLFVFSGSLLFAQAIQIQPTSTLEKPNFAQEIIDSDSKEHTGYEVSLAIDILDRNLIPAISGLHDAFIENPTPLANAIINNSQLADVLRLYLNTSDPAIKSTQEDILISIY